MYSFIYSLALFHIIFFHLVLFILVAVFIKDDGVGGNSLSVNFLFLNSHSLRRDEKDCDSKFDCKANLNKYLLRILIFFKYKMTFIY